VTEVRDQDEILLRGRLSGPQKARLDSLLDMMYRPSELAEEIGFEVRQVYRVYVPAGCPHTRDTSKHLWINGKAFREWAKQVYRKRKLGADEAFCLTCKRAVKVTDPAHHERGKLKYLTCVCPHCERRLARITEKL